MKEITVTITVYRDDIYGGWLATYPNGAGQSSHATINEARALVTGWWGCTNWRRAEKGIYLADTAYREATA